MTGQGERTMDEKNERGKKEQQNGWKDVKVGEMNRFNFMYVCCVCVCVCVCVFIFKTSLTKKP